MGYASRVNFHNSSMSHLQTHQCSNTIFVKTTPAACSVNYCVPAFPSGETSGGGCLPSGDEPGLKMAMTLVDESDMGMLKLVAQWPVAYVKLENRGSKNGNGNGLST